MNLLDVGLIAVLVLSAFRGVRVGAAAQIATFSGLLVGLCIGAVLVLTLDRYVSNPLDKTIVALILLLGPASVCASLGRRVGIRAFTAIRRARFGYIDSAIGILTSLASTLVVIWLFSSILLNSAFPVVSRAIAGSATVRQLDKVMPPVPDAFASVERYLSTSGFPLVLVNVIPQSDSPVTTPSPPVVRNVTMVTKSSMVKIVAIGCGQEQEGSGFSVGDNLVVTNAHVIAGTESISGVADNGDSTPLVPVLFDPRFDIAVLREVTPLMLPTLRLDPETVARGSQAVVLGYPGGGPLMSGPAGVIARFDAEGRDIYDTAITNRVVYELRAIVRPGNSGGPLVEPSGLVIGVVFSRSATNPDVGYALSSPGVLERVTSAEDNPGHPGTERCTN